MAKNKIYAVAKGKTVGLFDTWDACKASVDGFSGAVYKSFTDKGEAEAFLLSNGVDMGVCAANGQETETQIKKTQTAKAQGNKTTAAKTQTAKAQKATAQTATAQTATAQTATAQTATAQTATVQTATAQTATVQTATAQTAKAQTATAQTAKAQTEKTQNEKNDAPPSHLTAYVDGSFDAANQRYAYGCVMLLPDGTIETFAGRGDEPDSALLRNVTGEMLGAMHAVKWCIDHGYKELEICYDYAGIEMWATGAWKTNKELTQKYAGYMRERMKYIKINFTKIAAHTGVKWNEEADRLAKSALEK